MKFTIDNAELTRVVGNLNAVISSKPIVPVLSGFLAEVKEGILTLTASDSEVTLSARCSIAPASVDGTCVIDATHLVKLVAKLPAGATTVECDDNKTAKVTWETGNSTIPAFAAVDFPSFVPVEEEGSSSFSAKPSAVRTALAGVSYAAADDPIRPTLNTVYFDLAPKASCLAATDAKKIAIAGLDTDVTAPTTLLLPRNAFKRLSSILAKASDEEPLKAVFNAQRAVITCNEYTLSSVLPTGKFPNYKSILPKASTSTLVVDRKGFATLCERLSVCANRESSQIRISLTSGSLSASAEDLSFGVMAKDAMLAEYEGDDLTIGFAAGNIIGVLSALTCNTVKVLFNGNNRAALFQPSDEEASIAEKSLLMPLALV